MKQTQKVLKNPSITTTWPLNDHADTGMTIAKLKHKLFTYGILSEREQAYLSKYTDFGKTDQKQAF